MEETGFTSGEGLSLARIHSEPLVAELELVPVKKRRTLAGFATYSQDHELWVSHFSHSVPSRKCGKCHRSHMSSVVSEISSVKAYSLKCHLLTCGVCIEQDFAQTGLSAEDPLVCTTPSVFSHLHLIRSTTHPGEVFPLSATRAQSPVFPAGDYAASLKGQLILQRSRAMSTAPHKLELRLASEEANHICAPGLREGFGRA